MKPLFATLKSNYLSSSKYSATFLNSAGMHRNLYALKCMKMKVFGNHTLSNSVLGNPTDGIFQSPQYSTLTHNGDMS